MSHEYLLGPTRLLRLIYDLEADTTIIEAKADVGIVQIDLHELNAVEGTEMLRSRFDADDLAFIDRFANAAGRCFE